MHSEITECLDTVGSGKTCEWLVRLLARFVAKVPSNELTSYLGVEDDMRMQNELSDTLSSKLEEPYVSKEKDTPPLRLSHEYHLRLVDVSTITTWNPEEDEEAIWDCDEHVECVDTVRSEVCLF